MAGRRHERAHAAIYDRPGHEPLLRRRVTRILGVAPTVPAPPVSPPKATWAALCPPRHGYSCRGGAGVGHRRLANHRRRSATGGAVARLIGPPPAGTPGNALDDGGRADHPHHQSRVPSPDRRTPPADSPPFQSDMAALWQGIVNDSPTIALPAFFPEQAYEQLKTIIDAQGDYENRLVHDYSLDITAAHDLLGPNPSSAVLVTVEVPANDRHWVPPGVCDNRIGYFEVANFPSRLPTTRRDALLRHRLADLVARRLVCRAPRRRPAFGRYWGRRRPHGRDGLLGAVLHLLNRPASLVPAVPTALVKAPRSVGARRGPAPRGRPRLRADVRVPQPGLESFRRGLPQRCR